MNRKMNRYDYGPVSLLALAGSGLGANLLEEQGCGDTERLTASQLRHG